MSNQNIKKNSVAILLSSAAKTVPITNLATKEVTVVEEFKVQFVKYFFGWKYFKLRSRYFEFPTLSKPIFLKNVLSFQILIFLKSVI